MIRHVNLGILEVILMVVQEILTKSIKMNKMTITLTLHLKKYRIESKLQEEIRDRLLSKNISFKLIKAVMFNIDNHEKDILEVGYKKKKFRHKKNGIN